MFDLCLILNGPPGSGKDTLAKTLSQLGFEHREFKTALYAETAKAYKIDTDRFKAMATDRDQKEAPNRLLPYSDGRAGYRSPREAMIHISEEVIKPTQGLDYFGRAAMKACVRDSVHYAVFSDGGFGPEVAQMQDIYHKVIILQLIRPGYSFKNDSREYLYGFRNTFEVHIEEDNITGALEQIMDIVAKALIPWQQIHRNAQ